AQGAESDSGRAPGPVVGLRHGPRRHEPAPRVLQDGVAGAGRESRQEGARAPAGRERRGRSQVVAPADREGIRAAQVGLGWWGKTLVESVQGVSPDIQFVAAVSRSQVDDHQQFAAAQKLTLYKTYEEVLADKNVDAVVLATPHSLHSPQVVAAAKAKK